MNDVDDDTIVTSVVIGEMDSCRYDGNSILVVRIECIIESDVMYGKIKN